MGIMNRFINDVDNDNGYSNDGDGDFGKCVYTRGKTIPIFKKRCIDIIKAKK